MTEQTNLPGGGWNSTLWSVVQEAGENDSPGARDALEKLARSYWKPIYFFVRRRVGDVEQARDLTQAFFAYLMEKDLLAKIGDLTMQMEAYKIACDLQGKPHPDVNS